MSPLLLDPRAHVWKMTLHQDTKSSFSINVWVCMKEGVYDFVLNDLFVEVLMTPNSFGKLSGKLDRMPFRSALFIHVRCSPSCPFDPSLYLYWVYYTHNCLCQNQILLTTNQFRQIKLSFSRCKMQLLDSQLSNKPVLWYIHNAEPQYATGIQFSQSFLTYTYMKSQWKTNSSHTTTTLSRF